MATPPTLSPPKVYLRSECPQVEIFPSLALDAFDSSGNLKRKVNTFAHSLSRYYKVEPMLDGNESIFIPSTFRLRVSAKPSDSLESLSTRKIDIEQFKQNCRDIFRSDRTLKNTDFVWTSQHPINDRVTFVVVTPDVSSTLASKFSDPPER